jgi:hypothetical protein
MELCAFTDTQKYDRIICIANTPRMHALGWSTWGTASWKSIKVTLQTLITKEKKVSFAQSFLTPRKVCLLSFCFIGKGDNNVSLPCSGQIMRRWDLRTTKKMQNGQLRSKVPSLMWANFQTN